MYELYDNANGSMQLLIKTNYIKAVELVAKEFVETTQDEHKLVLLKDGVVVEWQI